MIVPVMSTVSLADDSLHVCSRQALLCARLAAWTCTPSMLYIMQHPYPILFLFSQLLVKNPFQQLEKIFQLIPMPVTLSLCIRERNFQLMTDGHQ